jgi:hypothetical protein
MFNILGGRRLAGETDILKWLTAKRERKRVKENVFGEQEKNRA